MNIFGSLAAAIIPAYILLLCLLALARKKDAYGAFIRGANEGMRAAVGVLPYMAGMMLAIEMFRTSGAADYVVSGLHTLLGGAGMPREVMLFMFIRPLSGAAALGELNHIFQQYGPGSPAGQLASVMMGSTETLLYTIPVYFGVVKITKTRHALAASVAAMIAGYIAASLFCMWLL